MKHMFGLAAFAAAILVGAGLTAYVSPRPTHRQPAPLPEVVEPTPPPAAQAIEVPATVRQVALDRAKRHVVVTLAPRPDGARPAPSSVWVTTYLFIPDGGATFASAPVRVDWPAGASSLDVTSDASWVGGRADPGSGYFARVVVATAPKPADLAHADTSLAGASPVVVGGAAVRH
jgi:hypothetical protein